MSGHENQIATKSSNQTTDLGIYARTFIEREHRNNRITQVVSNESLELVDGNIANENIHNRTVRSEYDNAMETPNSNNELSSVMVVDSNQSLEEHRDAVMLRASNISENVIRNSSTANTQVSIDGYFPVMDNPFHRIHSLNETMTKFNIRCKIIYLSPIRHFGLNGKVFDGIVCDLEDEIKVVAFNENVDRLYNCFKLNEKITIENGQIQRCDENYRTPYSAIQIRLIQDTKVEQYASDQFNPTFKITKHSIHEVSQMAHGRKVDIEGNVIYDNGLYTGISENNRNMYRRRSLKVQDETGILNVTIWNSKNEEIPEIVISKTIRVRNGKINVYNDYVSINVSEQTIIQFN